MEKITVIQMETLEGLKDYVIIDRGNSEFTSMTKATYDEQQAAALNDIDEL